MRSLHISLRLDTGCCSCRGIGNVWVSPVDVGGMFDEDEMYYSICFLE